MKTIKVSPEAIAEASGILKAEGVVIFPTETVYGIGALASSGKAVERLFEIKGRPKDKPLQILIAEIAQVDIFASEISIKAKELMEKHWPGPLTLVFKKKPGVSDLITACGPTIGLRMPDNKDILKIIKESGPLAASSANLSGQPAPISANEVEIEANLLVDGGKCETGQASTVIDVSVNPPRILRPGKIFL